MRKKSMVTAVILAIMSAITLANVAFAAPPADKQGNSHGKTNVGKGKATDSTDEVDEVEGNIKCTIEHKGREITVSINAVPAHIRNHDDELAQEETDAECLALKGPAEDKSGDIPPDPASPENTIQAPEQGTINVQETEQKETTGAAGGSAETVKTCDKKSIELNKEEKLTLDLHNKTRKENGLKPLCVDPTLQKAAREHSKDMIKESYFGHNSRNGETSGERLKGLGYDWRATGENLAWGSGSSSKPKSRFEAWMKSEGHKKNILDKNFEQVGVGVARGELKKGDKEQTVYTVDFGTRKR